MTGVLILLGLLAAVAACDGGLVLLHRRMEHTKDGRAVKTPRATPDGARTGLATGVSADAVLPASASAGTPLDLPNRCGVPRTGSVSNPVGRP